MATLGYSSISDKGTFSPTPLLREQDYAHTETEGRIVIPEKLRFEDASVLRSKLDRARNPETKARLQKEYDALVDRNREKITARRNPENWK